MRIWIFSLLICFTPITFASWFLNHEQQAEQAFQQQEYDKAAALFNDAYRRGVALYKDGRYEEAAQAFEQVERDEVKADAQYNLGNAYFQQKQYDKAISAYKNSLKQNPDNEDARHNLAIAEQMKQQQDSQQSNQSDESQQQDSQQANQSDESQQQDSQQSNQSDESQQQDSQQANQSDESQQQDSQQANQSDESQQQDNQAQSEQMAENEQQQMDEQNSNETAQMGKQSDEQAEPNPENNANVLAEQKQQELNNMADFWLNRLENNPQQLLRNQFYLDSRRSDVQQQERTW
jgi:Ca-activated chloride channel family protein